MKDADRAYIVNLVNVVKSGNPAQELLSQLNDFLKNQNQDVASALLKQMYEIMLNDLTNQNPVVFAAAYNAARIIHANLKENSPTLSDQNILNLQNKMFADLQENESKQVPQNTKLQNLKSYGAKAITEILEDALAKNKNLLPKISANNTKQVNLTPKQLKFDGTLINISTPNYSQVPLGAGTLPRMANVNPSALPVGQRGDTLTKVQTIPTPGTGNDQRVYAYMGVPTDPMERDLPTPAVLGASYADRPPVTGGYQGATNSTSSTYTPAASEYAQLILNPPSGAETSPTFGKIPERPLPINRSRYQPWAPQAEPDRTNYQPFARATQQYAGVPPEVGHEAIDIATQPNINNISPAATVFTPTPPIDIPAGPEPLPIDPTARPLPTTPEYVAIDIPPESSDTSTEDTASTAERTTTNQKYYLSLTDKILTEEIKKNDNLLAQRMIAGSLLANMGLPTSEIDRILDKAFVSNLDSAEFKSLEGARLLKLREIIAGIYKGGTADINSVNKEITNTANIFLTRIGSKKLNNENYVADNFSDLEEIKKESLERGNKLLSDSLDNPGSKDWTDAVLDSITNEITYPKMINDRYFKLTDKNSNNYSFKNRMQLFGGAFGTGAALYVIASLFFPPLAFIGALLLTFAFVGAVMTVLVEGLSKLLTGLVNFTMGVLKLASGLALGITDVVKSPFVAIANLFRSEDKKFEYFALTKGALSGLDYIQKTILPDPKDPKSLYSEKKPERFLTSRDSLQGKLETVSAGKTTATPAITPTAPIVTRPTPAPTAVATPAPIAPTATTSTTTPAIVPLTDFTTPVPATTTTVPVAATATTTATPTPSVASTTRSGSFSAPAALPSNPATLSSTSPVSVSTAAMAAAMTPDQPARTSTLNTMQVTSAEILAAAVKQKNDVEAELKANPSTERKAELERLLGQSDSMIKREQEKLQQANQPLVSISSAPPQPPIPTYLTSPLGSAIAGSPLGSSPVLKTTTPSIEERRSTTAAPANYGNISDLQPIVDARDVAEKARVTSIPAFAAMSFDGLATTGSNVKPSIPAATDPAVRRPPPVPGSNYGAMPRREDGSGGVGRQ